MVSNNNDLGTQNLRTFPDSPTVASVPFAPLCTYTQTHITGTDTHNMKEKEGGKERGEERGKEENLNDDMCRICLQSRLSLGLRFVDFFMP